jgi:hypothetical protein
MNQKLKQREFVCRTRAVVTSRLGFLRREYRPLKESAADLTCDPKLRIHHHRRQNSTADRAYRVLCCWLLRVIRYGFHRISWSHESCSPPRQIAPVCDPELGEQRRDMEFHSTDRNVQARRDFLIRPVAQHRVEDFALPRAQGRRACQRPPLFQQLLRTRYHRAFKRFLRWNKHLKISRFLSSNQALHRKETRNAVHRILACVRFGAKLCYPCSPFTENENA